MAHMRLGATVPPQSRDSRMDDQEAGKLLAFREKHLAALETLNELARTYADPVIEDLYRYYVSFDEMCDEALPGGLDALANRSPPVPTPPQADRSVSRDLRVARSSPPFTVVYILGAGHCGSTLLSLLLNGHSRMLALSELRRIDGLIVQSSGSQAPGTLDGALWRRVRAHYESSSGVSFDALNIGHPSWKTFARWNRARIRAWAEPCAQLFDAIAGESGRDILIDSSKSWQQLYLLGRSGRVPIKVLHVVRDGRAVLHSYNRKYDDFLFSLGQWIKPSAMALALRTMFAQDEWATVRYEELASDPGRTLSRICRFLGTDFEPAMLQFRHHPWCGIHGNRMAQGSSEEIRLDEKWRRDLPRRDRVLFELLGGALNRYYGYRFRARQRSSGR